jgi:hypothetical protein
MTTIERVVVGVLLFVDGRSREVGDLEIYL